LIKWKGYGLEDATWENADNMNNAQMILYEYHKKIDNQRRQRLINRPINSRTTRASHIAQRQLAQLNRVQAQQNDAAENEFVEAPDREIVRQKCESDCKNGRHCRRTTLKGDKCFAHSARDYNLRIKKSNIKESGFGLFTASKPLRIGGTITTYSGTITYNPTYGKYVLEAAGKYINANRSDSYGSYANDCRTTNRQRRECKRNNARFKLKSDGNIDIVAIKNIDKNEEIFIAYGRQYWNDFDRYTRQMKEAIRRSLIDQRRSNNNNNDENNNDNSDNQAPIQRRQSKRIRKHHPLYTIRILTPITNHIISGGKM
jgi:hypothetical protein